MIASDLYVHEVVGRVIHITTRILCCERVTLFSADESRRELAVYLSADGLTTLTVPYERGLVGAAAATKKVLNIEDAYQDPRFNQEVRRASHAAAARVATTPHPLRPPPAVGHGDRLPHP